MNTEMKKHVVYLLDTYHKRARQIAVLRYELSHPVKITEEEMIDTLQFAHQEGAGQTEGHISNKTPYIALNTGKRLAFSMLRPWVRSPRN